MILNSMPIQPQAEKPATAFNELNDFRVKYLFGKAYR